MVDTLIIPIHGPSATLVVPMARYLGPERILLVHSWQDGGEADRNCRALADHFRDIISRESRRHTRPDKRGKLRTDTKIETRALTAYTTMDEVSRTFKDLLLNEYERNPEGTIHIALIDEIPMGYITAAFSVSPIVRIRAYTAQVGYDILRQRPSRFRPEQSIDATIQEVPLLNQITDSIRWLNKRKGARKVLKAIYRMLDEEGNLERWFRSKEVVDHSGSKHSVVANHMKHMRERGEGLELIERNLDPTTEYSLTPLARLVAPFITIRN